MMIGTLLGPERTTVKFGREAGALAWQLPAGWLLFQYQAHPGPHTVFTPWQVLGWWEAGVGGSGCGLVVG